MATDRRFKFEGVEELQRRLLQIAREVPDEIAGPLYRQAEFVMGESREKHVPVALTPLQSSGKVHPPEITRSKVEVTLSFGGSSAPYALALHEHPSDASPPSWEGKTLSFTKPGTGHKYLERPLRKKQATLLAELAADIDIGRLV